MYIIITYCNNSVIAYHSIIYTLLAYSLQIGSAVCLCYLSGLIIFIGETEPELNLNAFDSVYLFYLFINSSKLNHMKYNFRESIENVSWPRTCRRTDIEEHYIL